MSTVELKQQVTPVATCLPPSTMDIDMDNEDDNDYPDLTAFAALPYFTKSSASSPNFTRSDESINCLTVLVYWKAY